MSFATVNLGLNIGTPAAFAAADECGSVCNPGGSYICTATTKGCDTAGTCAGTSTVGPVGVVAGTDPDRLSLNARLSVEEAELGSLRAELERVLRDTLTGAAESK
jgi:hypothetical protein